MKCIFNVIYDIISGGGGIYELISGGIYKIMK